MESFLIQEKTFIKDNNNEGFQVIGCVLGWVVAFYFLYVVNTNVHITSCNLYQNYQIKILEICGLVHKEF